MPPGLIRPGAGAGGARSFGIGAPDGEAAEGRREASQPGAALEGAGAANKPGHTGGDLAGTLVRIAVLAVILVLVVIRLAAVIPAVLTPLPPLDPRTIHSGEFE